MRLFILTCIASLWSMTALPAEELTTHCHVEFGPINRVSIHAEDAKLAIYSGAAEDSVGTALCDLDWLQVRLDR